MILVFGFINIDLVARVVSIPQPGETVLSSRYETLFGGKGANQAVVAARVSLPHQVAIVACIGDDAFGRSARDNLARNSVVDNLVTSVAEPTGCAFITVDERGENAITVGSAFLMWCWAENMAWLLTPSGASLPHQSCLGFGSSYHDEG
ncbi:PfkB family carbohydrate kinase [Microvirga sesbaniae]|uniref:PfkB family carbohydrate kinase n=1 Tax=Microvirga sesbaniae TaxID=681392 RepID=UPI0021C5B3AC|nr:PfkB family carbohydrate kinase [Microvirga sp. HBU67692]